MRWRRVARRESTLASRLRYLTWAHSGKFLIRMSNAVHGPVESCAAQGSAFAAALQFKNSPKIIGHADGAELSEKSHITLVFQAVPAFGPDVHSNLPL